MPNINYDGLCSHGKELEVYCSECELDYLFDGFTFDKIIASPAYPEPECDHWLGIQEIPYAYSHPWYPKKSTGLLPGPDKYNVIYFKFCPECGVKLI